MRFPRPTTRGVLILTLAAIPLMATTAQSMAVDVMKGEPATWVTLVDQSCSTSEVTPMDDATTQRLRDVQAVCDIRFDDPRVSGTATTIVNYDCHAEAGCVTWGQQEIVGPDGGWSGSFEGLIDPTLTERSVAVLSGTGGYAGMTFVVTAVAPLDEAPSVMGLVYVGGAPPLP